MVLSLFCSEGERRFYTFEVGKRGLNILDPLRKRTTMLSILYSFSGFRGFPGFRESGNAALKTVLEVFLLFPTKEKQARNTHREAERAGKPLKGGSLFGTEFSTFLLFSGFNSL